MAENGYSLLKASLPGQLPNTVSIYIRNNRKQTIQLRTSSRFTPQEISTAVAKRLNVPPVEQLLFHKGKLLHLSATTKEI